MKMNFSMRSQFIDSSLHPQVRKSNLIHPADKISTGHNPQHVRAFIVDQ